MKVVETLMVTLILDVATLLAVFVLHKFKIIGDSLMINTFNVVIVIGVLTLGIMAVVRIISGELE